MTDTNKITCLPPTALLLVILALLSGCDNSATEAAHSLATDAAPALDQLTAELEKLPELEQQSAERVARHIAGSSREDAVKLADAIRAVKAAPRSSNAEKRPVPITTRPAIQGDISSYYKTNATLEVDKDADIVSRVSGLVKTLSLIHI